MRDDRVHLRQAGEKIADQFWFLGGDEEVEIVDDFLAPAKAAGRAGLRHGRMLAQGRVDGLGFGRDIAQPEKIGGRFLLLDCGKQLLRGLLAKARQGRHGSLAAGLLELGDARDVQFLVQGLDFLFPEAGNFKKLEDVLRKFLAQLFVIFEPAGRDELLDFLGQGLADALHLVELIALGRFAQVAGEHLHGPRAVHVGADFERILPLERKVARDVLEDAGDRVGGDGGC